METYRWPDRDASWIGARPNQRSIDLFGSEAALDTAPAMSNMQRYLSGSERAFFQTNPFQLHSRSDPEPRRFDFDPQYEPQAPWPDTDKQLRQRSPDYRSNWSVSSGSSYNYSHQDDLSTTGFGSPDAGSSPREYASQDTTYSDYNFLPTYSLEHDTVGAGGSCTLQEIQHYPSAAEDAEPPMEHDDYPDMKMGYACEQETILFHGKMDPDEHRCAHIQDDDFNRARDAESVKPVVKTEDEADSDYSPHTASKRRRRRGSQSSVSSKGSSRRNSNDRKVSYPGSDKGRVSKRTKASSSPKDSNPMNRPFPCPFAGYSCQATFASKNEWKRHVSTQHIRLGFWRCQLCPSSVDGGTTTSFNDFNRKDLFAQHLRRMHMAPSPSSGNKGARSPPSKENPITEDNMADFQAKCYQKLRDAPTSSSCLFCNRTFEGHGSWDERMEHVGRHFEKDKKGDARMYGIEQWREDPTLEAWLRREGLVELDDRGSWQLGDGAPRRATGNEVTLRRSDDEDTDVSVDD